MTLDSLRDWHARRVGWRNDRPEPTGDWTIDAAREHITRGRWWRVVNGLIETSHDPMTETIDGAAAALPEGWKLFALEEGGPFTGWSSSAVRHVGQVRQVFAHGKDEVTTRYLLAKLAWEQEATDAK